MRRYEALAIETTNKSRHSSFYVMATGEGASGCVLETAFGFSVCIFNEDCD